MARYAIRGVVSGVDGGGAERVLAGATVTIYEEDGTTLATIYAAKTGGVAIAGSALTADAAGRFLCYVESSTYPPPGSFFSITAAASGFTTRVEPDVMP